MSKGFDEARAERNWLERLGEKIPGFRGFQDRELRREVDKMQREYLAEQLTAIKRVTRQAAEAYTDAGRIGDLDRFERIDRRLEGLSQSIRFADYGASGFFDVEKIGEAELESLYRHDLSMLSEVESLAATLETLPSPGADSPVAATAAVLAQLAELEQRWSARATVINDIVETAG